MSPQVEAPCSTVRDQNPLRCRSTKPGTETGDDRNRGHTQLIAEQLAINRLSASVIGSRRGVKRMRVHPCAGLSLTVRPVGSWTKGIRLDGGPCRPALDSDRHSAVATRLPQTRGKARAQGVRRGGFGDAGFAKINHYDRIYAIQGVDLQGKNVGNPRGRPLGGTRFRASDHIAAFTARVLPYLRNSCSMQTSRRRAREAAARFFRLAPPAHLLLPAMVRRCAGRDPRAALS